MITRGKRSGLLALLAMLGMSVVVSGQTQVALSPEEVARLIERLQTLEDRVDSQEAELAESRQELRALRAILDPTVPGSLPEPPPVRPPWPDPIMPDDDGDEPGRVDLKSRRRVTGPVRIGGRLEIDYVDTENEKDSPAGSTMNPNGTFDIDKFRLRIDARVAEGLRAQARTSFRGNGNVTLDALFIELDQLPLDGKLSVGKRRRFIKMNRRGEIYPLLGSAFWRGRDTGLRAEAELGRFTFLASLSNGLSLADGRIQKDRGFPATLSRHRPMDGNVAKELGLGVEVDLDLGVAGDADVMAFTYQGRLADDDLAYLAAIQEPGRTADRDQDFWGLSLDYDVAGFELQAQFISANEGADLDRLGWYVQPSWKIDLPGFEAAGVHWLDAVRPLFRYGVLRNDLESRVDDSRTWNRSATTAGAVLDVANRSKLILEYTWNNESLHRHEIDNDELGIQLRLDW